MIPIAIFVLFGVTIGIPLFVKIVVKILGDNKSEIPVLSAIGMYAYSFSSFLITCTLCGFITNQVVQWILILYSMISSILFLILTYWADLSTTLESRIRMFVVLFIVVC